MLAVRFSRQQARHAAPPAAAVRAVSARASGGDLHLRPGRPSDRGALWRLAVKERLNPLGLDPERCTVAERGSRTIGVGQLKPLSGGRALKLATLVVEHGERGSGVGTALVQELVQQAGGTPIYLITTSQRTGMFHRCGFGEVERVEAPACLQVEFLAGLVVSWLVAWDRLVLMRSAPASGGDGEAHRPSVASQATDSYDSDGDVYIFGDVYIDTSEPVGPWWRRQPDRGEERPSSPKDGEAPSNSAEGGEEPLESAEGGEEPRESGGDSSAGESGGTSSAGWQWPDLGGLGWGGSSTGGDDGGDSASGGIFGGFGGDSFGGDSFGGGSFDSGGDAGGGD